MPTVNFTATSALNIAGIDEAWLAAAIIDKYNAENGTTYTVADFGAGEGDTITLSVYEGAGVLQYTSADDAEFRLGQVDNE